MGPDGWGPRGSKRGRARARKEMAPTDRPHWQRVGERGGERRGRELAPTCGVRLSGANGAQTRARGWACWADLGRKWIFHFPRICNTFSILFSIGFSIQIQTKFQIQTKSNMCNNSKNI
jgi:hypothetical protein